MISLFLLAQGLGPGECLVTGLCGLEAGRGGIPSGPMFVAVGMVFLGVVLWRRRKQETGNSK
jgi:hypothetical protein